MAVGLTVVAVALVARWLVPGIPWPAAIALGAIVAPPDAAAATAVLTQLRPPHRILVILQGESLFNDASALLIYRIAVAAAVTGSFAGWAAVPMLAAVAVGSVVLGVVAGRLAVYVTPRITDIPTSVVVQFLTTFAVWMLAEQIHLSGILTVVVFAIYVAQRVPDLISAKLRIQSYAVWEVVVFVLNVLAFILIGLQLKPILARLSSEELARYATAAIAVCAAVILVRIVWVMSYTTVARWGDAKVSTAGAGGGGLVRHARHRHAGGGAGAARRRERRFSPPRLHSLHRLLRRARHARRPGDDRRPADEARRPARRRLGRPGGPVGARRDCAGRARDRG